MQLTRVRRPQAHVTSTLSDYESHARDTGHEMVQAKPQDATVPAILIITAVAAVIGGGVYLAFREG